MENDLSLLCGGFVLGDKEREGCQRVEQFSFLCISYIWAGDRSEHSGSHSGALCLGLFSGNQINSLKNDLWMASSLRSNWPKLQITEWPAHWFIHLDFIPRSTSLRICGCHFICECVGSLLSCPFCASLSWPCMWCCLFPGPLPLSWPLSAKQLQKPPSCCWRYSSDVYCELAGALLWVCQSPSASRPMVPTMLLHAVLCHPSEPS